MSTLKAGKIQSGISITPANNMVFDASADNGTFTFKREDGSVLFTVDATGKIDMDGTGVFQKDNILGTVSQSVGVPTGAVIEAGSNANGEYVKFADGTLICIGGIPQGSLTATVTFPSTFISKPSVSGGTNTNADAVADYWGSFTTTSATQLIIRWSTRTDVIGRYTAIGRWF